MLFRVDGLRDLPDLPHDLGVAEQVVDELGVSGAEESLADRAKPGLGRRARLLHALVPGEDFDAHEKLTAYAQQE